MREGVDQAGRAAASVSSRLRRQADFCTEENAEPGTLNRRLCDVAAIRLRGATQGMLGSRHDHAAMPGPAFASAISTPGRRSEASPASIRHGT